MSDAAEQSSTLIYERAFYVGNVWQVFLTGINTTVGLLAVVYIYQHSTMTFKKKAFYITYSASVVVLMLFAMITNSYMGQRMWIDDRFYEGGPYAYFVANNSAWFNVFGSTADILIVWMGDALLLYRCYIIWDGKLWIIGLPVLICLASVALSLCVLVESALPTTKVFFSVGALINFTVPWIALSTALNAILTALICFRILRVRYRLNAAFRDSVYLQSLPDTGDSQAYTSAVAIFVESALPLSVIGIITCVTVGRSNYTSTSFLDIWGTVIGIFPLLIVARIAMGVGWTRDTSSRLSTSTVFTPARGKDDVRQTHAIRAPHPSVPFGPSKSTIAQGSMGNGV